MEERVMRDSLAMSVVRAISLTLLVSTSALAQEPYWWWNAGLEKAETLPEGRAYAVYDAQSQLFVNFVFRNEDGSCGVVLGNSYLYTIDVRLGNSERLIVGWEPPQKATPDRPEFGASVETLIEPGGHIVRTMSLRRPDNALFTPGEYTLEIDVRAAASALRCADGSPWMARFVPHGILKVTVRQASTPQDAHNRHRLEAEWAQNRGDYASASEHYRALLSGDPYDRWGLAGLATISIHKGNYEEAVRHLEMVLTRVRDERGVLTRSLAFAYVALGHERAAATALRRLNIPESQVSIELDSLRAEAARRRRRTIR